VRVSSWRPIQGHGRPIPEAKEVIGGYWMIEVTVEGRGDEWASRCPGSENEVNEVRQVQEMSDCPADVQKVHPFFGPGVAALERKRR